MRPLNAPTSRRPGARGFWTDCSGATAVEYGLLVACLTVALLGVLSLAGSNISATLTRINNTLSKV